LKTARFAALSRALFLGLAVGAAALTIRTSNPVLAAEPEAVVTETRDAVASFKRRNYEEAVKQFEAIVAKRRTADDAAKIRAEVTEDLAKQFAANSLADAGLAQRLRDIGQWVLQGRTTDEAGATQINGKLSSDDAGITRFVDEYMSETNIPVRVERARAISQKYGEFAVPYIAKKYLADSAAGNRALARTLLGAIGEQATPALVQLLKSADAGTREYAAHALGEIRDNRAVPALTTLMATSGDAADGNAAKSALDAMNAGTLVAAGSKMLWFLQAEGYYRNASAGGFGTSAKPLTGTMYLGHLPTLVDGANRTYAVWRMRDGNLEFEKIPGWNYADCLAEEAAQTALKLGMADAAKGGADPMGDPFVMNTASLLARISAHAYAAGRDREASSDAAVSASVGTLLGEGGVSRLSHLMGFAGSAGRGVVVRAIEDSLGDGYSDVTVTLCDVAASLGAPAGGDEHAFDALVAALGSPSRQVSYAAARALVATGSKASYGANGAAAAILGQSLGETDQRTAVLIAEDPQVATAFQKALSEGSVKYNVVVYRELKEGLLKVRNSPTIDIIVMQGDLGTRIESYWEPSASTNRDPAALAALARKENAVKLLKDDVRTKNTPLLLVTPDSGAADLKSAFAGTLDEKNFSTYGKNGDALDIKDDQFQANVASVLFRTEAQRQMSANHQVIMSAGVLAGIDANGSTHDVDLLLKAAAASIGQSAGRLPEAKVALAGAISHLASFATLTPGTGADLVRTLSGMLNGSDATNTAAVRGAAAGALGNLFAAHPALYVPGSDSFTGLVKTMRLQLDASAVSADAASKAKAIEDITAARNAAGVALGKASLTPQERLQVAEAAFTGGIPVK
jgi:HEAT repeat protein